MSGFVAMRRGLAVVLAGLVLMTVTTFGDVTPAQRKQAQQLVKELAPAGGHVRKKEFADAEKVIKEVEDKLTAIAKEAGATEDEPAFTGIRNAIAKQRKILETAMNRAEGRKPGRPQPVSFAREVAPIISANCLECHSGRDARAGLSLDTFANWRKGGRSGLLAVAGNPQASLLMLRLVVPDPEQRMPKDKDALPREDIETIANWIGQGANFDGMDEMASLKDVTAAAALASFEYPKPKGGEKVVFTRDIAPWMSNLCGGCHNERRKSGGLSLVSYFDMMQGGESGVVVIPGDLDSRLFRLVGGKELPRMPANQSRLTRKNYEDMVTWFKEGNTFDGTDPTAPLASFVRSGEDVAREKFAKMSEDERRRLRDEKTAQHWKKAFPKDEMNRLDGEDLILVGNVSSDRFKQVQGWATDHLSILRKSFRPATGPLWNGRLAVYVLKDRFSYDEFGLSVDGREAPKEMTGHSVVTISDEDAYVVLLDVGDDVSASTPGLHVNLIDHLTGAFLKRGGARVPDWLGRGTGLALASQEVPGNAFLKALPGQAAQVAAAVPQPEDIFNDSTFSSSTLPAVGMTLVNFLVEAGGPAKFAQFVEMLREGQPMTEAAKAIYGADLTSLAQAYFAALKRAR